MTTPAPASSPTPPATPAGRGIAITGGIATTGVGGSTALAISMSGDPVICLAIGTATLVISATLTATVMMYRSRQETQQLKTHWYSVNVIADAVAGAITAVHTPGPNPCVWPDDTAARRDNAYRFLTNPSAALPHTATPVPPRPTQPDHDR